MSLLLKKESNFSTSSKDSFKNFKQLAQNGIIAKLEKPNPLFNKSNIILEEDNKTKVSLIKDRLYNAYIIPTKEYKSSGLISKLAEISDKINKLNLEQTVNSVNSLLTNSQKPMKNLGKVLDSTKSLINSANKTLTNINTIIGTKEFKSLGKNLKNTLRDLSNTLKTRYIILLISTIAFIGCSSKHNIYLLPNPEISTLKTLKTQIGVTNVEVPSYLNSDKILVKDGLKVEELNAEFATNPDKLFTQQAIQTLKKALNNPNVFLYPWDVKKNFIKMASGTIVSSKNFHLTASANRDAKEIMEKLGQLFNTVVLEIAQKIAK